MASDTAALRRQISILEKRDETNIQIIMSLRNENKALREQVRTLVGGFSNMDSEGD